MIKRLIASLARALLHWCGESVTADRDAREAELPATATYLRKMQTA